MKIIDSHAHYNAGQYNKDREELLHSLQKSCEIIVNVGTNTKSIKETLDLVNNYNFIYGILGYFPCDVLEFDKNEQFLKESLNNPKIVAVGEIGLDYHWNKPSPDIQKKYFEKQIELAKEMHLPICIHSRDAEADTLAILKKHYDERLKAVIHCYSYGVDSAKEYINMGFYFGIGGTSTYKTNEKVREAIKIIPMPKIVLETDAPYLTPEPFRGKRNSSDKIEYVANLIADIKGLTPQQVIDITNQNAKKLFGI